MNFLTKVIRKEKLAQSKFNTKKIRNAIAKRDRIVIFWCRLSGAYYLNTHRIYELPACTNGFDDASAPLSKINININLKPKE
jgi:hypothetical protein